MIWSEKVIATFAAVEVVAEALPLTYASIYLAITCNIDGRAEVAINCNVDGRAQVAMVVSVC